MKIKLHRWPDTAQNRDFRNNTNSNWNQLENTYNDIDQKTGQAVEDSSVASEYAEEANQLSQSVQEQLNTIVINGDSSVEAAQARLDTDGNNHNSLKGRLDNDFKKNANRIEILQENTFNVTAYENLKIIGGSDWDYRYSIQKALDDCEQVGGGIVHLMKLYTISGTIRIPSNIKLIARKGAGIKLLNGSTGKIITNKDTLNGNEKISIVGLTIIGNRDIGTEFDAGIHLVSCVNSAILKNKISNTKGDGITLGNINEGVLGTCIDTTISFNEIDNIGRMGIALTDAKDCDITYNRIKNLSNAPLDMGIAIDLEPNFDGQYCQDNIVEGNRIINCRGGIYLASRKNVTDVKGNKINNNIIRGIIYEHGIRVAYSETDVKGNKLSSIAKHGIYVGTGGVVQISEIEILNNRITDASSLLNGVFDCIRLENVVHSLVNDNIFKKTSGANNIARYAFSEDVNSGYNSYNGNNARQIGLVYSIQNTSRNSHNIWDSKQVNNVHEGFTALGDIKMNGNKLQIGVDSNTFNLYGTNGKPGSTVGNDNDIAFVTTQEMGMPVGYRKINGDWHPFGQVRFINSISSPPNFIGQEALVEGFWYKAIGTLSPTDWRKIT